MIRVLLALSAHFDYELDQINIEAAFLNGELEGRSTSNLPRVARYQQAPYSDFTNPCTDLSNLLDASTTKSNNGLSVRALSRQGRRMPLYSETLDFCYHPFGTLR